MQARLDYKQASPEATKAMMDLHAYVHRCGLEHQLLELVKLRADGETEQRLYLLSAWRECPFYTDRERAALAWTEALTRLEGGEVPDAVYAEARAAFSDEELVKLTMAIVAINGANRINIAFRTVPGSYRPAARRAAE